MDITMLPSFIRYSTILSDDDRRILSQVESLPQEDEIDEIRTLPEVRELLQSFIGDENTRNTHLQLKAKELVALGEVDMAWKVLLL
ncbi:hypothetical protein [Sphingobacterium sp. LRF_L2]|uniref:hypothetical protein n=1 Tax=Sphingobacterium sp. LRF_L2 TaxID=3369421 RepID=UPI003F6391D0